MASASQKKKREKIPQITVSKQILEGIGKGVLFKIFNPMMLGMSMRRIDYRKWPGSHDVPKQYLLSLQETVGAAHWPRQTTALTQSYIFYVIMNKASVLTVASMQEKPLYCAILGM